MKLQYGSGTCGLHGIGNRDNAHHASAHRQEQRSFAFVGQAFGFVLEFAQIHAMLVHELGIAHYAHGSVAHARNTAAGNLAKFARLGDAGGPCLPRAKQLRGQADAPISSPRAAATRSSSFASTPRRT